MTSINPEIVAFAETQIIPRYVAFDAAHRTDHCRKVIENALALAPEFDVDTDMVYVIAAYHDLGLADGRAGHEVRSGELLQVDLRLRRWFSEEQITVMAEAVEDHRASSGREPRSIYGEIVAEADRDIEYLTILTRTLQYGLENFPNLDKEQHFQRTMEHVREKYGVGGYLKLRLDVGPNRARLDELRRSIEDEASVRADFDRLYAELAE